MDDNQIRLVLDLLGQEKIGQAMETLRQFRGSMQDTYELEGKMGEGYELASQKIHTASVEQADALKFAKVNWEELERATSSNVAVQKQAGEAIDTTLANWNRHTGIMSAAGQATVETTRANGDLGRGVLQTSYAVQDFTSVLSGGGGFARALGSVQNNIPVLLTGLGLGAGLAGAVSLVSVGFAAAIPLIQQFAGESKEAAEEAKKAADALERFRNLKTAPEEAAAKRVDDVTKKFGGENIVRGIDETLRSRAASQYEPFARAEIAETGTLSMTFDEWMAQAGKQNEEYRNRLVERMRTDPSARAEVVGMARERRGNFRPGFAEALGRTMPDAIEAAEKQARDADQFTAQAEGIRDAQQNARKKAAELQSRQAEQATAQAEGIVANREAREKAKEKKLHERRQQLLHDQKVEEEGIEQEEEEKDRAAKQDERNKVRAAKQFERMNDPTNQLAALQGQREDAVTREALSQWNAGGRRESPDELRAIVRQAVENMPRVGDDLGDAIQMAVQMIHAKVQRDLQQQAARVRTLDDQMDGMTPMLPPQMRRTW